LGVGLFGLVGVWGWWGFCWGGAGLWGFCFGGGVFGGGGGWCLWGGCFCGGGVFGGWGGVTQSRESSFLILKGQPARAFPPSKHGLFSTPDFLLLAFFCLSFPLVGCFDQTDTPFPATAIRPCSPPDCFKERNCPRGVRRVDFFLLVFFFF